MLLERVRRRKANGLPEPNVTALERRLPTILELPPFFFTLSAHAKKNHNIFLFTFFDNQFY